MNTKGPEKLLRFLIKEIEVLELNHTYAQFRVNNQPTPSLHVFGLQEETGVPGVTCKLSTQI